jgi:hypothetical protein
MIKSDPFIDPVDLLLRSLEDDAVEWVSKDGAFHRKGISIKPIEGWFGLRPSVALSMDGEAFALQRTEQLSLRKAVDELGRRKVAAWT